MLCSPKKFPHFLQNTLVYKEYMILVGKDKPLAPAPGCPFTASLSDSWGYQRWPGASWCTALHSTPLHCALYCALYCALHCELHCALHCALHFALHCALYSIVLHCTEVHCTSVQQLFGYSNIFKYLMKKKFYT